MLINQYEYVVNPVSELVIFGLTLVSDVCGLAVEEPDFLLFLFIPTIFMIVMVFIVIITLRLFFQRSMQDNFKVIVLRKRHLPFAFEYDILFHFVFQRMGVTC